VRDWLWSATGLSAQEVQMVRGAAGSTMASAILRFNTHTGAATALSLLQSNPDLRFWHSRFTVQWSRDSAVWPFGTAATQTDPQEDLVVETEDKAVQTDLENEEVGVQTTEDDDGVSQGGSPTEGSTTSRARSDTASPGGQSSEQRPTVLEPPGEAGERFRQRVEVKKELAEALTEVDQVKEELQKLKEEVTEKSCEGEASSSQPLKKVKLESKD